MNSELKEEWLKALKSGKYKKGKFILHDVDTNEYCCLGVLCDILKKKNKIDSFIGKPYELDASKYVVPAGEFYESNVEYFKNKDMQSTYQSNVLPFSVMQEYNIGTNEQSDLISINDNSDEFDRIIHYIEENL